MANRASLIRQENSGLPVKRRGKHFIEFNLGGGKVRHITTIEPLHYGPSKDQEVDTAWVNKTVGQWTLAMEAADFNAYSKVLFSDGQIVQWTDPQTGEYVTLQPQQLQWTNDLDQIQAISDPQPVAVAISDDVLTWAGAYGAGRDFSWFVHPRKLVKHLKLSSMPPAPAQYIIDGGNACLRLPFIFLPSAGVDIYVNGSLWDRSTQTDTTGTVEFRSATGEVLWEFAPPSAWDAETVPATVTTRLRLSGNSLIVEVRVPYAWLLTAAYPVTIDPTFTDGYGGDVTTYKDTVVRKSAPTYNYGIAATALLNDAFSEVSKALLKFDLSSLAGDATCDSATLYFYKGAAAGGDAAGTINAYSVASGNDGWPEGSKNGTAGGAGDCCWNYYNQESGSETSWAGSAGLETSGTDYEATSLGNVGCNYSDAIGTEYTISLTAARIEAWFGATNTNYGLLLYNSGRLDQVALSDHATTGYRPKLVVEYTLPPLGVDLGYDNPVAWKQGVKVYG